MPTNCSFSLCDGDVSDKGFNILYASSGFTELFGYRAAEVVGERCLVKLVFPCFLQLPLVAQAENMELEVVEKGFRFMNDYALSVANGTMQYPGPRSGYVVYLTSTKGGRVFVCEVALIAHQVPYMNRPFTVCMQRDITSEVPMKQLLEAACLGSDCYLDLVRGQETKMHAHLAALGADGPAALRYFEEKTFGCWKEMWDTIVGVGPQIEIRTQSGSGSCELESSISLAPT